MTFTWESRYPLQLTPRRLAVLIEALDQFVANGEESSNSPDNESVQSSAVGLLDELNALRASLAER
jgi:hypothetical protein